MNHTLKIKTGKILSCRVCSKKFYRKLSEVKERATCSRQCYGLLQRKRLTLSCDICHKQFEKPSSYFKWHKIREHKSLLCSRECRVKSVTGSLNPNWIVDRKSLKPRRAISEAVQLRWRNLIFKRDDWTCRLCEERNGNGEDIYLEAHHIKTWSKYPELRSVVSNGITLCSPCHNKTKGKEHLYEIALKQVLKKLS